MEMPLPANFVLNHITRCLENIFTNCARFSETTLGELHSGLVTLEWERCHAGKSAWMIYKGVARTCGPELQRAVRKAGTIS